MELFWGIALMVVGSAASVFDNWRHAVVNPSARIPWIGNPPVLPRAWFLPRAIMIFAFTAGVITIMRASDWPPFMGGVLVAIALLPSLFVAVAHNRRVKRRQPEAARHQEV